MANNSDQTTTGNSKEKVNVESGYLLVIDQFMLGNLQFISPVQSLIEDTKSIAVNEKELRGLIEGYGGCLLNIGRGAYQIFRDTEKALMVVHSLAQDSQSEERDVLPETVLDEILDAKGVDSSLGSVFIDTRCVVFVDLSLLADKELFSRYRAMRDSQRDKDARDLLRSRGAIIRYGFRRVGDELGVFRLETPDVIALWPDIVVEEGNRL